MSDQPLTILFVNHEMDPVLGGGTAERTWQLARACSESGVRSIILTMVLRAQPETRFVRDGVEIVSLPCIDLRYYVPLFSFRQLREWIEQADVVHLMGHWTLLNAMIFLVCRRLSKPFLFSPAGALKIFGRSLILKRIYNFIFGKKLALAAAKCIAITEAEMSDFTGMGVPRDQVAVIPNGIAPEAYMPTPHKEIVDKFRDSLGVADSPFILFLGRLNAIKGPDILLEAFLSVATRFPHLHLVFAGPDGGMERSLREVAAASGVSGRVHFAGFVKGVDKSAAISAARLLAIPSRHEAMSIVVLESGVLGTPVLLTDQCGLNALAKNGAVMMSPPDAVSFGEALLKMLLLPEEDLRKSGESLRRIVLSQYQWRTQALLLISLAQQVRLPS